MFYRAFNRDEEAPFLVLCYKTPARQLSAHKTHNQQDIVFNNLIFDLYSTGKAGCMDINLVNQSLNSESY